MKKLVIIGAGGFGREILGWAKESTAYRKEWEIAGFLDDRPEAISDAHGIDLPILGSTVDYQPTPEDVFICALGNPALRKEMRNRFTERGGVFTRIIHESCVIGRNVNLGMGVILCPRVVLTCDLSIGDNSALNVATAVGHDAWIGDDCQISSFCDLTGHVRVGDSVMMGSRVSILPGRSIGDHAVVGAGSVVVSDIPESVTVFGNPAKILTRHS